MHIICSCHKNIPRIEPTAIFESWESLESHICIQYTYVYCICLKYSIYLFISISIYLYVNISFCLSFYITNHLFIYLSIYLFIYHYLSIYRSFYVSLTPSYFLHGLLLGFDLKERSSRTKFKEHFLITRPK